MDKKYIKIIKHLYKNLQKKDELRKEFEKTSNSIFLYSLGITSAAFFIIFSFFSKIGIEEFFLNLFLSSVFGIMLTVLFPVVCQIKMFNNLVSKKLSKHNLFNLYGKNYIFDSFLYNIIDDIIKNNDQNNLNKYVNEITHIINSINDESRKNDIKIRLIKKMEIDIDSQLTNLNKNKSEEENVIKIDSKSIVVNN